MPLKQPSHGKPQQPSYGKPQGQNPIIDLQVWEPEKPKPKKKFDKMQAWAPINTNVPYYPPQMPYTHDVNKTIPVINQYTINTTGPLDDHSKLSMIYEDVLPQKHFSNTFNTLGERIDMNNFIRGVLVQHQDGENISLHGSGENSILSHLKFIQLNPYQSSIFSNNPYKDLPEGMLIYTSCYPIRYDKGNSTSQCAKNSVGVNIRIYELSNAEYEINKQNKINYHNYNLWREIAFYEYIREEILKKKVCPNFALMYSYFIAENSGIDFRKVNELAENKTKKYLPESNFVAPQGTRFINAVINGDKETVSKLIENNVDVNESDDSGKTALDWAIFYKQSEIITLLKDAGATNTNQSGGHLPIELSRHLTQQAIGSHLSTHHGNRRGVINKNNANVVELNMDANTPHTLVSLTESPNYNLYSWASKMYVDYGNIKKMVHTGYHDKNVWFSILFQLMVSLYVMQKHNMAFRYFTIEDNVYIKDTKVKGTSNTYWKYVINGIEYYIPNHGYLVMIDSNYKDLQTGGKTLNKSKKERYKIRSRRIYGEQEWPESDINKLCFRQFKNTFNPNNFSTKFKDNNGILPPQPVKELLNNIYNDNSSDDIGYFIDKYMKMFVNNRIGSYLTDSEIDNIRRDVGKPFKKGDIVVHEIQNDTFKFVLYLSDVSGNNNQANVITKTDVKNIDLTQTIVPKGLLTHYSDYITIKQSFKPNQSNPSENNLLETYII